MPLGRVRGSVPRARDGGLELQDSGRGDRAKVPERLAPLLDVLGDCHGVRGVRRDERVGRAGRQRRLVACGTVPRRVREGSEKGGELTGVGVVTRGG